MTDSIETSDREAEDPRGPIRLPLREMRDEPVPPQPADPLRAALQLALEATPEQLSAAMAGVYAAIAAEHVQPRAVEAGELPQGWLPFDYKNPPEDGLMFVAVSAPETDCDVDDYGKTVGWHTGEVERTVCMVHFSAGDGGEHDFHPVDQWNTGKVPAEGWVTHYMPVRLPAIPESAAAPEAPAEAGGRLSSMNPAALRDEFAALLQGTDADLSLDRFGFFVDPTVRAMHDGWLLREGQLLKPSAAPEAPAQGEQTKCAPCPTCGANTASPNPLNWCACQKQTAQAAPSAGEVERVLRNFEITGPDTDGLLWLRLHGNGTTGRAAFNLGSAKRIAGQVALMFEQDRRAAFASQPAPVVAEQDRIDAERWRYTRRKACFTGNGDGTCAMQIINMPARIEGWPGVGQAAEFADAAIDAARSDKKGDA